MNVKFHCFLLSLQYELSGTDRYPCRDRVFMARIPGQYLFVARLYRYAGHLSGGVLSGRALC